MEDAAAQLAVPEADRPAFAEFYEKMALRSGRALPASRLGDWRDELEQRPAEVQVKAFMQANEEGIEKFLASSGVSRVAFERTMLFTAIYGQEPGGESALTMEKALERVMKDFNAAAENKAPKCDLTFKVGTFDRRHQEIRSVAFPYRPASCTSRGDTTFDCFTPDGMLVGYIGFGDEGYIDDLAIIPAWQGRGAARGLVCSTARSLAEGGVDEIYLHVRACNYPAIGLYKGLGFSIGHNEFPPWYDWHGGYKMSSQTKEVAARMR